MEKEKYFEPEFEILLLETANVITNESVPWGGGDVDPGGWGDI